MGLKVLILACRATGFESIKYILEMKKHSLVGVFSEDYENKVNDGITCSDYKHLLDNAAIPFRSTDKIHKEENVALIKGLKADVGLSVGWRRLVREPVISLPPMGFINFHTSDLPKYRGFASTSWAILNGDDSIAITAHRMMPGQADQGDILLKERISITPETDIGSLFLRIQSIIPGMVHHLLDQLETGTIKPVPQNEAEAILSYPRHPSDGWIDWSKSAVEIDRLVRSIARPYPGAFTCWNMKKVIVWKGYVSPVDTAYVGIPGHVVGSEDGLSVKVLTGRGIYVITEIQVEDEKNPVAPAKIIAGMQQRLGLTQGEIFGILRGMWGGNQK